MSFVPKLYPPSMFFVSHEYLCAVDHWSVPNFNALESGGRSGVAEAKVHTVSIVGGKSKEITCIVGIYRTCVF